MPLYQQPQWCVELPEGWSGEREDESTLFHRTGGVGSLSVTLFCDKENVSQEKLVELASATAEEGHSASDVQIGPYRGLYFSYLEEGTAWREWYLAAGCCLFFISYDCAEGDAAQERAEIEAIVAGLTLRA